MATFDEIGSGGGNSSGGGSENVNYIINVHGGVISSGDGGENVNYTIDVRGGARVRTTTEAVVTTNYSLAGLGGAIAGGTAVPEVMYRGLGGAIVSGLAAVSFVGDITTRGGAKVSGTAFFGKDIYNTGIGGARVNASVKYDVGFAPSGGLTIEGGIDEPVVDYYFDLPISWDSRRDQVFEKDFSWNIGLPPLSWYRVEGFCLNPTCESTGFDASAVNCEQGTNYTQTIAARGLADLCDKLKAGVFSQPVIWPLKSITRFSKPTYKVAGDNSCQVLIPEDFCSIPECMEFCIDERTVFRLALSMNVQDTFYEYTGSGTIYLGGSASTSTDGAVSSVMYIGAGRITLGGEAIVSASYNYPTYTGSGGLTLGGEASVVSPNYFYEGEGGLTLGGEASVTSPSYFYEGEGGLILGGGHRIVFSPQASGGLTIGGAATSSVTLRYIGSGVITLDGSAEVVESASYFYEGTGGFTLGGEATTESSFVGIIPMNMNLSMEINKIFLSFDENIDSGNELTIDSGNVVSQCGCDTLPLVLTFSQNIAYGNALRSFLDKNGYSLANDLDLSYKSSSNSWTQNLHFRGIGDLDNSVENWNILFEWTCSTPVTSIEQGHWELKFLVRRISSGVSLTTRGKFIVPPTSFCHSTENKIKITYNTKTFNSVVSSGFVDLVYFEDQLGLFRTKYWNNNSSLVFAISDQLAATPIPRYDIGPFFPTTIFN
jgi:hypothetical protein